MSNEPSPVKPKAIRRTYSRTTIDGKQTVRRTIPPPPEEGWQEVVSKSRSSIPKKIESLEEGDPSEERMIASISSSLSRGESVSDLDENSKLKKRAEQLHQTLKIAINKNTQLEQELNEAKQELNRLLSQSPSKETSPLFEKKLTSNHLEAEYFRIKQLCQSQALKIESYEDRLKVTEENLEMRRKMHASTAQRGEDMTSVIEHLLGLIAECFENLQANNCFKEELTLKLTKVFAKHKTPKPEKVKRVYL